MSYTYIDCRIERPNYHTLYFFLKSEKPSKNGMVFERKRIYAVRCPDEHKHLVFHSLREMEVRSGENQLILCFENGITESLSIENMRSFWGVLMDAGWEYYERGSGKAL